jgi:hypothetical protein
MLTLPGAFAYKKTPPIDCFSLYFTMNASRVEEETVFSIYRLVFLLGFVKRKADRNRSSLISPDQFL